MLLQILSFFMPFYLGFGILRRLKLQVGGWQLMALAYPLGLAGATLAVFLLSVFGIRITALTVPSAVFILGFILFLPDFRGNWKRVESIGIPQDIKKLSKLHLIEWVGVLFVITLLIISFWRAFYMPITTYDSIHGIDLMARAAIADGKIDSQMYRDLGEVLSTQPYYAPFAAISQIIYRLGGFDVGKVWIPMLYASLLLAFYLNTRRVLHPFFSVFLLLILAVIPEMYGYSYLLQTDFSNAVFVTLGIIYLHRYLEEEATPFFWLSALLLAAACWTRSETIIFSAMTYGVVFLLNLFGERKPLNGKLIAGFVISLFAFGLWNLYYLPVVLEYSPESYFKFGFWDSERLTTLITGMWEVLLDLNRWSYVLLIFLAGAAINLLVYRDQKNVFLLIWILAFVLTFLVLLYHLQLNLHANIKYTWRRGLFKLWPVMIFYLGTSALFIGLSARLKKWEKSA